MERRRVVGFDADVEGGDEAGIPYVTMPFTSPVYIVGDDQARLWREDPTNPHLADRATVVPTVEEALSLAMASGGTDKVVVFDGSYGNITCNAEMAQLLRDRAPIVERLVAEQLLPKWLAQRGLD